MNDAVAHESGFVELVPSRLYVVGGTVALDGRVSWAPTALGRFQFLNCYVLREGEAAMIVDPGPRQHAMTVVRQLNAILPSGSALSLFLTRPEYDSFGALEVLADSYRIDKIVAGGTNNAFDAFDLVTKINPTPHTEGLRVVRVPPESRLTIGGDRSITVLRPPIRLLVTYWAYDEATRTLFTSDSFSHGTTADESKGRVLTSHDDCDPEIVRTHAFTKFWWLPHAGANIRNVADSLQMLFNNYDIRIIAPSHGSVIYGREAVVLHYNAMQEVLSRIATTAEESMAATPADEQREA